MTAHLAPAPLARGESRPYGTRTAVELVLANAARRPDALAVLQWDQRLDYATLVAAAGRLASDLRDRGVRPETLVGVCLRRRPSMVVGVLGVLMAGGAYVPLDPEAPAHRRAEIAADAGLDVIVVDADTGPLLTDDPPAAGDVAAGDVAAGDVAAGDVAAGRLLVPVPDLTDPALCQADPASGLPAASTPGRGPDLDGAAYVLYTSGSTGRPKGVVVSHRSLVAHVQAFGAVTGAGEHTRGFGFTTLGFDVSVHDLFVPLVAGGAVALVGEADRRDPARLQRFAARHGVNWGFVPPALLPLLDPDALPDWRVVYSGAEAPGPEQVGRWSAGGRRFFHGYGPTETTVAVTVFETSGHWDRPLPIGRPLPNHRVVVVDEALRPVGPGEPGELLVGGVGLARGYLGDPALTALRFVPDPFGEPGQRLYRTGDRVRWLSDGNLLFLGRADRQVKIRGQRVELAEPETVLRAHPGVRHAVVQAVDGRLVAFCEVGDGPDAPDGPRLVESGLVESVLIEYVAARLPSVMVPARVLLLPRLPLAATGKVDAAALTAMLTDDQRADGPAADGTASGGPGDDDPAADDLGFDSPAAGRLAAIWARVLGRPLDRVRPADDFFAAGGHSIAAMRLVAAIRAELGSDIAAEDVYAGRTLAGLAERVAAAPMLPGAGRPELSTGNPPALSPSQRRLWFLEKLVLHTAAYNVAFAERLTGRLDVAALRNALTAVATRHEVLRWRIPDAAGAPHPVCDPPAEVPLPVVDLTGRSGELTDRLAAAAATPFDLAAGPVWRAVLYRLGPAEHVLAVVLHHAVADGWSQAVLYRDLAAAYAGHPLPPLPATFGDYARWRADGDARDGDRDLAWWLEHLAGAPTVLDLPRDRPRPPVQTYAGASAGAAFPPEVDTAVRGLAARLGTTPSAVLLAGLGHLLSRLTGGDDVVLGAIVADRRLAATEDLVGFFVDIVPVRLRMDGAATFAGAARGCLTELLAVTAHPAAPLDRIVRALGVPRDPARSPLVQVLFNVYNFAEPVLALPGCTARPERVPMPGSPFDLTVYVAERDGRFAVDVVYNPDLFDAERMDALLADYVHLVGALAADPDVPVADVPVRLTAPPGRADDHPPDPAVAGQGSTAGQDAASQDAASQDAGSQDAASRHGAGRGGGDRPATETERLIAAAWCEVLGLPAVRATDNFFDVGGHSIAMVAVQARLTELLGRELAVVDLFRYPNVRALAAHVDGPPAADRPAAGTADAGLARAALRAAARKARATTRHRVRGAAAPAVGEPDHAGQAPRVGDRHP